MFSAMIAIGLVLYSFLMDAENRILIKLLLLIGYVIFVFLFVLDKRELQFIKTNLLKRKNARRDYD